MTPRNETSAREPDGNARVRDPEAGPRVLMTLRVSRDSGRTWGRVTEVREDENPVYLSNPIGFPPCACPRCADRSPDSGTALRVES